MATTEHAELVIIGGGPAGVAAALEARRSGVSVCLLDENRALGGQIYRQFESGFSVTDARRAGREYRAGRTLIDAVERSGAQIRTRSVVWGIWGNRVTYVEDEKISRMIDAQQILLATGARDRPVAFPGWTLPGVMTGGAAKTLVSIQRVLPGRRILVAGSGPLVLAFSAQLVEYGANLVEVDEAAREARLSGYVRLGLNSDLTLLAGAVRYRWRLLRHRIPFLYATIVVRAEGEDQVERAVVARVDRDWRVVPGTERTIDVDTIVLGYGLETSSELARLCGCRMRLDRYLGGWIPERDEWMRTSVRGILAAGDSSGVAGAGNAIDEGRLAGIAAALDLGHLSANEADRRACGIRRHMRRNGRFRRALQEIYEVGPGLYELATDDTVICRCEEVTGREIDALILEGVVNPNIIRARVRAGMGYCQGRNCASQIEAAIARRTGRPIDQVEPFSVRPPVKPVPIEAIAEERVQQEAEIEVS